jgi:hypothetical protein
MRFCIPFFLTSILMPILKPGSYNYESKTYEF